MTELKFVLLIIIIGVGLCAIPLIAKGYLGSADSMHTIMTRIIIADGVKDTYEPYSTVSFTYPSYFFYGWLAPTIKSLPFRDFFSLALLGLVFVAMEFLAFYVLSHNLFKSKRIALFATILLATSKVIYQDFYFGLFPRLFVTALFFILFASYLTDLKRKWLVIWLMAIMMILCHPTYALLCLAFFCFYACFNYNVKELPNFTILFLLTSIVFISCVVSGNGVLMHSRFTDSWSLVLNSKWFIAAGLGLGGTLLLCFFLAVFKMPKFSPFLISGMFCLGLLSFFNHPSINIFLIFATISAIWFVCHAFTSTIKRFTSLQMAIILLAGLIFSFVLGSYLPAIANGTKITPSGGKFALMFYNYDSSLKSTLFLVGEKGGGKMAELANKIPLDVSTGWFVPTGSLVKDDSDVRARYWEQQEILHGQGIYCIIPPCSQVKQKNWLDENFYDGRFAYIVIDKTQFELPNRTPLLNYENYYLYGGQ